MRLQQVQADLCQILVVCGRVLGYQKEFIVAAIAVEKAGGAYVPLDYDYPNDRLLYMLEDSESQVLITSHQIFNEKNAEGDLLLPVAILLRDWHSSISHKPLSR